MKEYIGLAKAFTGGLAIAGLTALAGGCSSSLKGQNLSGIDGIDGPKMYSFYDKYAQGEDLCYHVLWNAPIKELRVEYNGKRIPLKHEEFHQIGRLPKDVNGKFSLSLEDASGKTSSRQYQFDRKTGKLKLTN